MHDLAPIESRLILKISSGRKCDKSGNTPLPPHQNPPSKESANRPYAFLIHQAIYSHPSSEISFIMISSPPHTRTQKPNEGKEMKREAQNESIKPLIIARFGCPSHLLTSMCSKWELCEKICIAAVFCERFLNLGNEANITAVTRDKIDRQHVNKKDRCQLTLMVGQRKR